MNNPLKILIIDDEEIERRALAMMLKYNRKDVLELQEAENGLSAIEIFREFQADIVLADINMPGINGLEAIRIMQKIKPETRFVIISAYNLFNYAQEALRLNVYDFLIKPIQIQDLNQVIDNIKAELFARKENTKKEQLHQEKMNQLLPLIESDCVFAIASMHSNASIKELLHMMQSSIATACVFIVRGENMNYIFLNMIKKRLQFLGMTCIGELINGVCVMVLISQKKMEMSQIREMILYIMNTEKQADQIQIGVGSICQPDENLRISYNQAMYAVQYAFTNRRLLCVYHETLEISEQKEFSVRQIAERISKYIYAGNIEVIEGEMRELFAQMQMTLNYQEIQNQSYGLYTLVCSGLNDYDIKLMAAVSGQIFTFRDIPALRNFLTAHFINEAEKYSAINFTGNNSNMGETIIKMVREQYMQKLTLENIADQLNYSFYYLSKLFKSYTGTTFSEYLTQYRVEKAKELLSSGEMSVKEIAYATGFNSQGYFAKIFKKYTGISPSEYKKTEETKPY